MNYLAKRLTELRPILDKKKDIELAIVEVKQKQEQEISKLSVIKNEFDSVSLELVEVTKQLDGIIEGCSELETEVLEYVSKALTILLDTDELLNEYELVVESLNKKIKTGSEDLAEIEVRKENTLKVISEAQSKLSRRENDLDIYKKRLDKKVRELGLDIKIKL